MGQHVRVLIPEEEIEQKIKGIADQISEEYKGQSLHLICILKGGAMFMMELAKRIKDVDISFDFMSVSSYGAGTTSSGIVKIVKDLDEP
ncbi:MAG TPA: hypoxanthine phosphoribosyltransferase, partial [Oribacterium sp.]|nr:hypoxanthine phosphoribosyltransferase [Oribacterium sp.]